MSLFSLFIVCKIEVNIANMEHLVGQLSRSRHPLFARLFGASPLLLQYNPIVHEAIIQRAERQVYGPEGLIRYEQREASSLKRLARRSLAQSMCQQALKPQGWLGLLRGVVFWLSLLPMIGFLLLRSFQDSSESSKEGLNADVVVLLTGEHLRNLAKVTFKGKRIYFHTSHQVHLGRTELYFLVRTLAACPAYFLHPELLSNMLRWLSYYAYMVHIFRPIAVAHFFEGVASSSLMTAYLREQGVGHINMMHGELFFSADGAFCEFDRFYVWGQHFKDVCLRRRNRACQFVIGGSPDHRRLFSNVRSACQTRPKRLLIVLNTQFPIESPTYIFILKVLQTLNSDWEVRVRPHPVYWQTWPGFVKALNADPRLIKLGIQVEEETQKQASLEQALGKSRVVVGIASMALIEAWIAGCRVIYLGGTIGREVVLDRFGGSRNVMYVDDSVEARVIEAFMQEPAVLNALEDNLVEHLSHVLSTL